MKPDPAGYRISKKAGYPTSWISGTTLVITYKGYVCTGGGSDGQKIILDDLSMIIHKYISKLLYTSTNSDHSDLNRINISLIHSLVGSVPLLRTPCPNFVILGLRLL